MWWQISLCFTLVGLTVPSLGAYTDPHCNGKQVIVHLFEWKWTDIERECAFLAKKGYCGVQVSPPEEHITVQHQWWERYQPVSYIINSRSGTESQFVSMVQTCKRLGVRIYVDAVVNHMAAQGMSGTGTAGSHFNADQFYFPAVPYTRQDFHASCTINNYQDAGNVRNCYLVGLTDLNQGEEHVRNMIAGYFNHLIDLGVAGFRLDASKHMWPADLKAIQDRTKNLPEGGRPWFAHEVIAQGGSEPITTSEYTSLGYVTEFQLCTKITNAIHNFGLLGNTGFNLPTPSGHALIFVDNHDNQRSHGGGGNILTYKSPRDYKMASAFLLANDFGFPRVMSSFMFNDNDQGPPHNGDYSTKDVSISGDGASCGNGWVCEHRWRPIANMVAFRNAVVGTHKLNWHQTSTEVAFSRGNKGFFAMAKSGHMNRQLNTGLPQGTYYDLISNCQRQIHVNSNGLAQIIIDNNDEPIVAYIVGGNCNGDGAGPAVSTTTHTLPRIPSGFARTVIFIQKQTQTGHDIFIRGGIDVNRRTGCTTQASTDACAIPIKARHLGTGQHFADFNAWSVGDHYLDWHGAESGQGAVHGRQASGTPAIWTTNNAHSSAYNSLNTYGDHYWMMDVDMDCSKTEHGWFEFKAVDNGQWESSMSGTNRCTGNSGATAPYASQNHMALCGYVNVYHFSDGHCTINHF